MPSDISTILADPEFQSASAPVQKALLSQVDPDFGNLSDAGIAHFVAPVRQAQNEKMVQGLGGELLDPKTGLPAYSDEQNLADQKTVALDKLRNEQAKLQAEGARNEDIAQTGKLASAGFGAATVPLGLVGLLQNIALKAGANPNQLGADALNKALENVTARAAVNPVSATAGSVAAQIPMMGEAGGTIQNLAAGRLALAGKELAVNAPINMALGTGLRAASGNDTSLKDLVMDAGGALIGGKNEGINPQGAAAIPEKLIVPGVVGERTYLSPGQQAMKVVTDIPGNIAKVIGNVKNAAFPSAEEGFLRSVKYPVRFGTQDPDKIKNMLSVVQDLGDVDIGGAAHDQVFPTALEGFNNAKNKVYALMRQATDNPNALEVDVSPLLKDVETSLRASTISKNPEKIASVLNDLQDLNRSMPLSELQERIEQGNAKFAPYYEMQPSDQASWRLNNPDKAVEVELLNKMRGLRNSELSKLGPGMADLGKLYGQISDAQSAIIHRGVVTGRINPISLTQSLGYLGAAANMATGNFGGAAMEAIAGTALKDINSSEGQLVRAFQRVKPGESPYAGANPPPLTPRPVLNQNDLAYEIRQQYLRDQAFKEKLAAMRAGEGLPQSNAGLPNPNFQDPNAGKYNPPPPGATGAVVPAGTPTGPTAPDINQLLEAKTGKSDVGSRIENALSQKDPAIYKEGAKVQVNFGGRPLEGSVEQNAFGVVTVKLGNGKTVVVYPDQLTLK